MRSSKPSGYPMTKSGLGKLFRVVESCPLFDAARALKGLYQIRHSSLLNHSLLSRFHCLALDIADVERLDRFLEFCMNEAVTSGRAGRQQSTLCSTFMTSFWHRCAERRKNLGY